MKKLTAMIVTMLPATAMAHTTGGLHLHAEHVAGLIFGAALIGVGAGLAVQRARAGRRK
ncbi:hypothetical protein [Aestuariivita boseongensis]|uniref:hypothetical protein n=1 Tax=Aestuariivita boseongensis TaxID=1470562 RepID=UPI0012FA2755|nr:hypothetical protein [Aestuariivita boseongensis]